MRGADLGQRVGVEYHVRDDAFGCPHVERAVGVTEAGDANVLELTDLIHVVATVQAVEVADR